ncbi:hypothetical protein [Candidatus Spongiihabitans sp.]|uniref:hypothetical protein n=1 Tax=Candidatus Spongiihabitans sp. TaxID=3101308 RepID=UPI003C7B8C7F
MTANTWHWKGARWIYAYVVFVIFNVALVFSPEVQKSASGHGLIIAFIFFFSIYCAKTDFDKNRTILKKIVWIIGLQIGQSILGVIFLFGLAKTGMVPVGSIPMLANMTAGIIILYLAMNRSTTFVSRTFYGL